MVGVEHVAREQTKYTLYQKHCAPNQLYRLERTKKQQVTRNTRINGVI